MTGRPVLFGGTACRGGRGAYACGVSLLVQKFGGSSVADAEKIRRCAARVMEARGAGHDVVVVVSAMGKTTDRLIELAHEVTPTPARREMDQLLATGEQVTIALMAAALESMGQGAVSLTGAQAGILTDEAHTRARIDSIDTARLRGELSAGRVAVVAGFQGATGTGEVTTLGRGGSDTTAVALAAALKAEECEIYTDVSGVFTADPRLIPGARKLERISYEEMVELAALGAKVMASRAMVLGMKTRVRIHVRDSHLAERGTIIMPEDDPMLFGMEQDEVTGVALKTNVGRVTIDDLPDAAAVHARMFAAVAGAGILVDDIMQTRRGVDGADHATVSFTVDHADLADVRPVLDRVLGEIGRGRVSIDVGLCRVSAVGVGMRTQTGVAARMFKALAEASGGPIHIQNITTSEIKIACILAKEDGPRALQAVHDAFRLTEGA